jgi:hypothetical protein
MVWLISRLYSFVCVCVSSRWYIQDSTMDMPLTVSCAITAKRKTRAWFICSKVQCCHTGHWKPVISQTIAMGKGVFMVSQMFGLQIHLKVTQILCSDLKIRICTVFHRCWGPKGRDRSIFLGTHSWEVVWKCEYWFLIFNLCKAGGRLLRTN